MSAYDRGTLSYFPPPRLLRLMPLQRKLRSIGRPRIKSPASAWWKKPSAFTEVYPTAVTKSFSRTRIACRVAFRAVRAEPKEADCRREELSDYDCCENRNHRRTSDAAESRHCHCRR